MKADHPRPVHRGAAHANAVSPEHLHPRVALTVEEHRHERDQRQDGRDGGPFHFRQESQFRRFGMVKDDFA